MKRFGTLFLAREPILTTSQLDKLADVFIAAGQLSAVSMVLPYILPELDETRLPIVLLGLTFTIGFWAASVLVVRRLE